MTNLEDICTQGNDHSIHGRGKLKSKTDPDATFMHMKDDHMKNAHAPCKNSIENPK